MGNPDWGALAVFVPFARGGQLVQVAVPGYKETMIATVLDGARETLAFDIYVTPLPDGGVRSGCWMTGASCFRDFVCIIRAPVITAMRWRQ